MDRRRGRQHVAAGGQVYMAVLMFQAQRVDRRRGRQHIAAGGQVYMVVLMFQAQRVDRWCGRWSGLHGCVDVSGTENGQMVWQAACCCRRSDPTCTSHS